MQTDTAPTVTLLEFLRCSGHTGTKEGCGDGDCGACTVALVGQDEHGKPNYQAINSCLVPLGAVAGRKLISVEGIANGAPHPVQQTMIDTAGSQCGYCTPGFIMSMFAGYYDGTVADDSTIEGNLCRCTGYVPIRKAARLLDPPAAEDTFYTCLNTEAAITAPTHLDGFFYPSSLAEVFRIWADQPEATLLAGGTDLGLELSHKSKAFAAFIALEYVHELKDIEDSAVALTLGAGVPLSHIEKKLHGIFPALDEMLHWFAARQIRNRATLGGNLGTASPIGDLPPVLLALDASVTLASATGERELALSDFFTGYRQTVLSKQELIKSVTIPKALSASATARFSQSYKVGKRGTDDISIVAAAFTLDIDKGGTITHARLAYGGVAATPVRALEVERFLLGKPWSLATITRAKTMLTNTFSPLDDFRGSAAYRKLLVANLFEKFFSEFSAQQVTA